MIIAVRERLFHPFGAVVASSHVVSLRSAQTLFSGSHPSETQTQKSPAVKQGFFVLIDGGQGGIRTLVNTTKQP